nr:MAG TPA: hypothetical protein [Caudoviricetes sp.]
MLIYSCLWAEWRVVFLTQLLILPCSFHMSATVGEHKLIFHRLKGNL